MDESLRTRLATLRYDQAAIIARYEALIEAKDLDLDDILARITDTFRERIRVQNAIVVLLQEQQRME